MEASRRVSGCMIHHVSICSRVSLMSLCVLEAIECSCITMSLCVLEAIDSACITMSLCVLEAIDSACITMSLY